MVACTRAVAAIVAVATALAACGGKSHTSNGAALSGPVIQRASPAPRLRPLPSYRISLPVSSRGPTTCTVYEPDYATQIVVDSTSLNVRAQCELWSANQADVGFLWGYEQAAATAGVVRLCTLSDPNRKMTASVIEDTGFVPVSRTQRAKGGSACAAILASGWTRKAPTGQHRS